RLLLERAAWQLRAGAASAAEAASAAGYGSPEAFSRAFARAYGEPPGAFAASDRPVRLDAPNGIHFHPPAGLLLPASARTVPDTFLARVVRGHLGRVRELLEAAAALPAEALERPLRPGFVAVWFEGEEASAAVMAERLVFTLEVWVAAMAGEPFPERAGETLLQRLDRAAPAFERIARSIGDRGAWDDAFVDALCEPPQSFTYGGVLAHVTHFGAIRSHALAGVLADLGAEVSVGDPSEWESAG
ncbi:MAG TPA: helix-turn-helix domain-containing protein, partial [Solirubrobacteraceae bacterium]|nr:helix-turn-helix domain-containing protein [Solirubrobacteraceae bacterium]